MFRKYDSKTDDLFGKFFNERIKELKDDLSIAIKNYINHLYSKESSKKIRKAMALRAEKEPILTWKYGYNIKNKVITIDDYSANIVKRNL